MQADRPRPDRARAWFFAFIIPLAILLAIGVAQLPPTWQQAAIMFWFVGMPILLIALRILRHATDIEVARLARGPQPSTAPMPSRAVASQGDKLRIVEVDAKKGGRVRL